MDQIGPTDLVGHLNEYDVRHLATHLAEAGHAQRLFWLLELENTAGRNAWFAAKEYFDDSAGFEADIALAARLAEQQERSSPVQRPDIGRQCRYALILSTLRTYVDRTPPTLTAALVRVGIWSSERGLKVAFDQVDERSRVRSLLQLAPHLKGYQQRIIIRYARQLLGRWRDGAVADFISRLGVYLHPDVFEEVVAITDEMEDAKARAAIFADVACYFSLPLVRQAVQSVAKIQEVGQWVVALSGLAPRLAELDQENDAFELVRLIWGEPGFAIVLARVVSLCHERILRQVLTSIACRPQDQCNLEALVKVLPTMAARGQSQEAIALAQNICQPGWKAVALGELAEHLPVELVREGLRLAHLAPRIRHQSRAFIWDKTFDAPPSALVHDPPIEMKLIRRLAELGHRAEAADLMLSRQDAWHGSSAIAISPDFLTTDVVVEMIKAAWTKATAGFRTADGRPDLLVSLLRVAPEELVRSLLNPARKIRGGGRRGAILAALIRRLGELGATDDALRETLSIRDWEIRLLVLDAIAPHLTPSQLEKALEAILHTKQFRTEAVAVLSTHLGKGLLLQALEAVRAVGDGAEAIPILAEVAYALPNETAAAVAKRLLYTPRYYQLNRWAERAAHDDLAAVLRSAGRGKSDKAKSKILSHLIPHLPRGLTECALTMAISLREASERASASSMVIARMVALGEHEAAIKTAEVHGITADVASVIAPYLDDVELRSLVEAINSRPTGNSYTLRNLAALLHQLADRGHQADVNRIIEEIPPLKAWIEGILQTRTSDKQWETHGDILRDISLVFSYLRPLPVHETVNNDEMKLRLLSDLSWLGDGFQRTARLSQLSNHILPADIPPLVFAIRKLPPRHRVHALVDLVRWLPSTIPQRAELLQEALNRVRTQKPPMRHFWIMELAPLIENREVIAEAIAAVLQTPDWRDADDFLAALSPLQRYQAWLQALQHLRQRPRGEFFGQIWKFVRQALSCEDQSSARSLFHAVTEVMRWWP